MSRSRKEREQEAERRRKMAAAFGDPLPDRSRDERPDTWGDRRAGEGADGDDEWLRSQVPPHHG